MLYFKKIYLSHKKTIQNLTFTKVFDEQIKKQYNYNERNVCKLNFKLKIRIRLCKSVFLRREYYGNVGNN